MLVSIDYMGAKIKGKKGWKNSTISLK